MKKSKKPAALSPTQSAALEIIGLRFVFYWPGMDSHFTISDRDGGYRHGHYDREREKTIAAKKGTGATIRALIDKGALEKVTWFSADATGRRAYIYKAAPTSIHRPGDGPIL